ncbi:hypothetical protein [Mesorhizobium sp. ES1-4]|uniref:hypothetical protein n=1 Tax=Mesorhizobium sp. ES1-4 TaxID=2876627 RepID=UPI001CCAA805|nr:hypothetical protein [Mesorhizobium sp. ES1-4]MBZ9799078.1 hypothetical protein [Mesorhizobium sp. ES1-4]
MTGGRERQIVADAPFKAEYAALPWRMGGEGTMEVLLLCPRQDGQWTVPRGTCSGTRTELRSAERAAFQDAGVTGRLGQEPVGRYRTIRVLADGRKESCDVTVFGLHVWGTLVSWPRDTKVLRQWMPLNEARTLVADPGLAELLASVMSGATIPQPDEAPLSGIPDAGRGGHVSGVASPAGMARLSAC